MAKNYITVGEHTFEVLSVKTAKGAELYRRYNYSRSCLGIRSLWDCYNNPSYAKERAYRDCVSMLSAFDKSTTATVIGYNCMQFSFGSIVWFKGIMYCMYITKSSNYLIKLI